MSEITAYRLKLQRAGFSPIPVIGKAPPIKGWDSKIDASEDEIKFWEGLAPSTGIFTKRTPTIDIDITDQAAADAVENLVREQFGTAGKILVRFGQAPKRAIPLRTSEPFEKTSVQLTSPDGVEHKIEILASGQPGVVNGKHKTTRQASLWNCAEPAERR